MLNNFRKNKYLKIYLKHYYKQQSSNIYNKTTKKELYDDSRIKTLNNSSNSSDSSFNSSRSSSNDSNKTRKIVNVEKRNFTKEKKLVEETLNTKNVGLFGFSFLSYIESKAKSLFNYNDINQYNVQTNDELQKNQILNRVTTVQCCANNPVEDRLNAVQLKNLDGYYLSVLDGHGGGFVVDYAYKKLHLYFDQRMKYLENSDFLLEKKITESLTFAFENIVSLII